MAPALVSIRTQAAQMTKTYTATSKYSAKPDGKEKLRVQLEGSGATVMRTVRNGFVVKMTRVQRSLFMRSHPETHLADVTLEKS